MGIKKKLGLGIASATLGLSLVGGGTYAYFSDQEVTNNTFAAGTLQMELNANNDGENAIIDLDKLKPGDTVRRAFNLKNDGTLDISKVLLETNYNVVDANNNNSEDFGKHIVVKFLLNTTEGERLILSKPLNELQEMDAVDVLAGHGLSANDPNYQNFYAEFEFVDNGKDQNEFQGDTLKLKWTFIAEQKEGDKL